jgi:SEC-C motif
MLPFDTVFSETAKNDARAYESDGRSGVPKGWYIFRELYCNEPACDCRRVIVHVTSAEKRKVIASVSYAFEDQKPPFDDEPRFFLDPLNPQSRDSDSFLQIFQGLIAKDPTYHEQFERHYKMWKQVVDDETHPDHSKVRSSEHDDPTFRAAFPSQTPVRRAGPKVGPNDPCPCGSGQKFKKCCRT